MPTDPHRRPHRVSGTRSLGVLIASIAFVVSACLGSQTSTILSTVGQPVGPPGALPEPSCGGLKILIEGALPCDRIADIAVATLSAVAPDHVARGVVKIDVWMGDCPSNGIIPNLDCLDNPFAQAVTVTFGPPIPGGPSDPALTVVVAPVSGEVLGIQAPIQR